MDDEKKLIERCRDGDREAQRILFAEAAPGIYRLMLRMTGRQDDAADLTQDTFVRVFLRFDQFDGRSAISSWIYRIAVNEALQFLRRRRARAAKLRTMSQDHSFEAGASSTADLRLDMDQALSRLPPDDRLVLLLRYQEGLDYREMAETLACAEGTVASRLNRARDRLRGILRKSYG